jgi:pyrroloquinoline quinone biosynthesis protein D
MTDAIHLTAQDFVELNPMYHYQWEEPQQAYILLYPEGLVKLNDTAAAVLGHCLDSRPVSAVIDALAASYADADIAADVIEFLQDCVGKGWIRVHR